MGVAGSGKTTIGKLLSGRLAIPFFDADDYHPPANKEKMRNGIALTDEDRQDWLIVLNKLAREEKNKNGAIIACSALKQSYRKKLTEGIDAGVYWIFLDGDYECIHQIMKERKGHYMPAGLLQSQFDILEKPGDAIVVDIREPPDTVIDMIIARLKMQGNEDTGTKV
jgi:carbohydrate kinase (thermoresistant glucokinase family)